tara:strand:+ start:2534 stop:2668 length:135 start_codon:yes stop_codon:yes gene_type:complete
MVSDTQFLVCGLLEKCYEKKNPKKKKYQTIKQFSVGLIIPFLFF